eukprot:1160622-Pelagomonas_calceolata.AAC.14
MACSCRQSQCRVPQEPQESHKRVTRHMRVTKQGTRELQIALHTIHERKNAMHRKTAESEEVNEGPRRVLQSSVKPAGIHG